jgi:hypothetical protein
MMIGTWFQESVLITYDLGGDVGIVDTRAVAAALV